MTPQQHQDRLDDLAWGSGRPVQDAPEPVGMSTEPVDNVRHLEAVSRSKQGVSAVPVDDVVATHDDDAHSPAMDEPWGGDPDLRTLYMSERFGSRQQLNRERVRPTYRPKGP